MAMIIKKKNPPSTQPAAAAQPAAPASVETAAPTKPISKLKVNAKQESAPTPQEQVPAAGSDADDEALNNITGPTDEVQGDGDGSGDGLVAEAGQGYVTKQYKDGTSTEETIPFLMKASASPMASVRVDIGLTRNLGNYESLKVSVGITLPCAANAEEIDMTYHEAKGWCDARIEAINEEITNELNG